MMKMAANRHCEDPEGSGEAISSALARIKASEDRHALIF
jgi:hypothetical protein